MGTDQCTLLAHCTSALADFCTGALFLSARKVEDNPGCGCCVLSWRAAVGRWAARLTQVNTGFGEPLTSGTGVLIAPRCSRAKEWGARGRQGSYKHSCQGWWVGHSFCIFLASLRLREGCLLLVGGYLSMR